MGTSLGSTVLETNSAGNQTAAMKYYAYGNTRNGAVVTEHKYTGQKYDSTGLYYYNSRYYDPAIGAFISPDT
ncbi:MAG: RHS repeat-associated core domain-containing protein, partial [Caldilineaceae bacterium]|nr:RHS repeat-associated core domain-containing protein [Caldilineaceae bacterium]